MRCNYFRIHLLYSRPEGLLQGAERPRDNDRTLLAGASSLGGIRTTGARHPGTAAGVPSAPEAGLPVPQPRKHARISGSREGRRGHNSRHVFSSITHITYYAWYFMKANVVSNRMEANHCFFLPRVVFEYSRIF
jgi:hypothetical protein